MCFNRAARHEADGPRARALQTAGSLRVGFMPRSLVAGIEIPPELCGSSRLHREQRGLCDVGKCFSPPFCFLSLSLFKWEHSPSQRGGTRSSEPKGEGGCRPSSNNTGPRKLVLATPSLLSPIEGYLVGKDF